MVRFIKLSYDASKVLVSEFNTASPTPGKIYLFELDGVDANGNLYKLKVSQNAIIPNNASVVEQVANYAVSAVSNPTVLLAYTTFVVPTYVSSGDFVEGTYVSQNGSKIVIDSTPIRKLCLKVCN